MQIKAYSQASSQAASLGAGLPMGMSFSIQTEPASRPQPRVHTLPRRWHGCSHSHTPSQLREFIQLKTNHLKLYCTGFWLDLLPEPVFQEMAGARMSEEGSQAAVQPPLPAPAATESSSSDLLWRLVPTSRHSVMGPGWFCVATWLIGPH